MTCVIGIENKDGTIEYIACKRSDIKGLYTKYNTEQHVRSLIDNGNKRWNSKPKVKVSSIRSLVSTAFQTDSPEYVVLFKDHKWFIQENETSSLRPLVMS